ncbi:clavesin-1-like isoform X2 [Toxorhynchites rutilus septentrionalis]|uniref:clavesin-1-like isoform X2 n=1 Tax=Toxorhynchites rutilus septentrionalis TaxID=329112 RepID=UPI00247A807A|nr:clavesin-1-like isoform X2 [Toxorhynchites rutilus septentrionalis]
MSESKSPSTPAPSSPFVLFDESNTPFLILSKDFWLRFDFEEFNDSESIIKAREELRERPKVIANSLKVLRQFLGNEPKLIIPIHDDTFLIRFLRPQKYYAESAFRLIKEYFTAKANADFFLDDISLHSLKQAFVTGVVQVLPERDQNGRRIICLEIGGKWNCTEMSPMELFQATHALATLCSLEPHTQLNGVVYIINCEGQSFAQLSQFTPKLVKDMFDYWQKYSPMRTKSIVIINNMIIFAILFKIIKPFLSPKWGSRIHFLGGNIKELHAQIDAECLPARLGGTCDYEYDGAAFFEFISA